MNEGRVRANDTFERKFLFATFKQFLPSGSVQRMLELGDALVVRVVEQASKDAVICDA